MQNSEARIQKSEVKERPILFKPELVRAIIEGRKTQTRRIADRHLQSYDSVAKHYTTETFDFHFSGGVGQIVDCPYGKKGDILWVRETFIYVQPNYFYKADSLLEKKDRPIRWKPSIHMPKAACRIFLRIIDVRAERLHEITDKEIYAEGIKIPVNKRGNPLIELTGKFAAHNYFDREEKNYARAYFASTWDKINHKRGYGWDTNPWVWVVEFEMIREQAA